MSGHMNQSPDSEVAILADADIGDRQALLDCSCKGGRRVERNVTPQTIDTQRSCFADQALPSDVSSCDCASVATEADVICAETLPNEARDDHANLPRNVLIAAEALRSALAEAQKATQFFFEQAQPDHGDSPLLEQFVLDMKAMERKFRESVLPEVATKTERLSKHSTESKENRSRAEDSGPGKAHTVPSTEEVITNEAWSASQALVGDEQLDVGIAPLCGSRIQKGLLEELASHVERADYMRALFVFGVDAIGIDSLYVLRRHFEKQGKIDFVSQPRSSFHTSYALVKMETAADAANIAANGQCQTIRNTKVIVYRIEDFTTEVSLSNVPQEQMLRCMS
eukprot:TRINITY_DN20646_c0_g1_i1.p1 TRINITY_DN20646_c0_g1~~TRINITY_DN20646_c0_g1_i1.p1  ORF type:complete len:340 (-),score=60.85 TRINITY_DN20646_c0_g1_i1:159-1178(-)